MKLRNPFLLCICLLALAVNGAQAKAQGGLRAAFSKSREARTFGPDILGLRVAAADFDNDQKPDGAVLQDGVPLDGRRAFRIRLFFTAGPSRDLTFLSDEPSLNISALDVNQDGLPDLVVEHVFTHKWVQVWLNDGRGQFRQARLEDFPLLSETSCQWKAAIAHPGCLVLALPSRSDKQPSELPSRLPQSNSPSSLLLARHCRAMLQANPLAFSSPRAPPSLRLI